ncbi:Transcription factor lepE [Lachnellula suecica]|uniref:Transcription factor lepE n=1 Tax=Lachnellula suecica TaxID=602035 RepID=A0A8T9CAR4_9HELO|nr:Transcription factor lepE [Lachnellula suecica]
MSLDNLPGDMPSSDPSSFELSEDTPSWDILSPGDASSMEPSVTVPTALYPYFNSASSGFFYKGRFLGPSHWINYAYQSSDIVALIQQHGSNTSTYGWWTFSRCKVIRKAINGRDSITDPQRTSLKSIVPAKVVSDQLVQAYLRTTQAVLPILHVASFLHDYSNYWSPSISSCQSFTATLLLVLGIGSSFVSKELGLSRVTTTRWVKTASDWLLSSKQEMKLSLDGLRLQCLLLLAEKINGLSLCPPWLCSGSLYRAAMDAGLHVTGKDNGYNQKSGSERRLWATIIELDLQTSMDWGSGPTVSVEDSNSFLPFNVEETPPRNDEVNTHRDESFAASKPKPINQFTQSSLQILLAKTQPVRLKIARFLNNKGPGYSFDATLALSAQLLGEFKTCFDLITGYRTANEPPTPFHIQLFDLLVRRFVLSLHHPFALKAMSDPRYAYSRQICIDTSMALLAHLSQNHDCDSRQLQLRGRGVFIEVYWQSCLYLMGEITNQIDTDTCFLSTTRRSDSARSEMKETIENFNELAVSRIAEGELNIKRYILACCLLAQVEAKQETGIVHTSVSRALESSLETCGMLLQAQLQSPNCTTSIGAVTSRNNTEHSHWQQRGEFLNQRPPTRSSAPIVGNLE